MKILVTGSNGFLGKYVCDKLKEKHELVGIGTSNNSHSSGIEYYKLSIDSPTFISEIKDKIQVCDIIIHLAACIDMNFSNSNLIDVNIKGTHQLVSAAKELSCKKIINISSVPVIGKPVYLPIMENHPQNPQTLYHISKLAAEQIVNLSSNLGIESINLRIPSPIGAEMNEKTILSVFLSNSLENLPIEIYGRGGRKQNYIDIRDIVTAIEKALLYNTKNETFNIASKSPISNINLAELCISLTQSSSKIIFNGNEDLQESDSWDISIEKAEKYLRFKPMYTIEDSIQWILREWKDSK